MDYDDGYKTETSNETYPWRIAFDGEGSSTVFIIKNNRTEHQDICTQGSNGFKVSYLSALPHYR